MAYVKPVTFLFACKTSKCKLESVATSLTEVFPSAPKTDNIHTFFFLHTPALCLNHFLGAYELSEVCFYFPVLTGMYWTGLFSSQNMIHQASLRWYLIVLPLSTILWEMPPFGWDYVYHVYDFKPMPVLVVSLPLLTVIPRNVVFTQNANWWFTLIVLVSWNVLIDAGWCAHPCEPVLCSPVKMYTFV